MKKFNLMDYNRMCAELLGFINTTPTDKDFNIHEHPSGVLGRTMIETNFTDVFTKDWNWIMEVVEKIKILKCVREITIAGTGVMFYVDETGRHFFPFEKDIKEAVVKGIWEFLNWYNESKNNSN
jgi:hypothetical protein